MNNIRSLSGGHLGEFPGDEMAALLASRDNIRQVRRLVEAENIPAFHRKRSPFDV